MVECSSCRSGLHHVCLSTECTCECKSKIRRQDLWEFLILHTVWNYLIEYRINQSIFYKLLKLDLKYFLHIGSLKYDVHVILLMTKIIWILAIATAFVVGSLTTGTLTLAQGPPTGTPSGPAATDVNCETPCVDQGELTFVPGDITGVFPSFGLTGGGTSGSVSLGINNAAVQQRVTGTCAVGEYIQAIDQFGQVTCASDQIGRIGETDVFVASASVNPNFIGAPKAFCPPGMKVMGGGFQMHPDFNVFRSNPTSSGEGWEVSAINKGTTPNPVVVVAKCGLIVP